MYAPNHHEHVGAFGHRDMSVFSLPLTCSVETRLRTATSKIPTDFIARSFTFAPGFWAATRFSKAGFISDVQLAVSPLVQQAAMSTLKEEVFQWLAQRRCKREDSI